jgi:hypothetical protein
MPSEVRYIMFDDNEVAKAVFAHWKARGRSLPRGTVSGMGAVRHGADDWAFRIELRPDQGLAPEQLECAGDELRDALVNAARAQSIPLPARAHKRIERIDEQLCLAMRIGGRAR